MKKKIAKIINEIDDCCIHTSCEKCRWRCESQPGLTCYSQYVADEMVKHNVIVLPCSIGDIVYKWKKTCDICTDPCSFGCKQNNKKTLISGKIIQIKIADDNSVTVKVMWDSYVYDFADYSIEELYKTEEEARKAGN